MSRNQFVLDTRRDGVGTKRILLIILILISILVVGYINEQDKTANGSIESEEITQKIVFVYRYTNWSDTDQNRGYYIDCAGNKVEYDVSNETEKYAVLPKLLSYLESHKDVKSEPCLDKNELGQYFDWLLNISLDYTFIRKRRLDEYQYRFLCYKNCRGITQD